MKPHDLDLILILGYPNVFKIKGMYLFLFDLLLYSITF